MPGVDPKKDNSALYQAVDIEGLAKDMLDTKMAKNILGDLHRHGGFQMHKPLLVPTAMQNAVNDNKMKPSNAVLKPPQSALKKVMGSKQPSVGDIVNDP